MVDGRPRSEPKETVIWDHAWDAREMLHGVRETGYQIAAVATSTCSLDLFDWQPAFAVSVVFGHEVDGVAPPLFELCGTHVRLPMPGVKDSLNVATAGGVVVFELLRKYRRRAEASWNRQSRAGVLI